MKQVRILAGFAAGFSLALFLFFLVLFLTTAPRIEEMETAYELNESIYDLTHSPDFDTALSLVDSFAAAADLPFIGDYAGYAETLKELLLAAKPLSETIRQNLALLIFITNISFCILR